MHARALSPGGRITWRPRASTNAVSTLTDAELKVRSRNVKSNALDRFGRDFEYKSHRITSKLDVEGSSPFSRSPALLRTRCNLATGGARRNFCARTIRAGVPTARADQGPHAARGADVCRAASQQFKRVGWRVADLAKARSQRPGYQPACRGPGSAPTCCRKPYMSTTFQCSTINPSRTRYMSIPRETKCRPVGGTPMNSPTWVPV